VLVTVSDNGAGIPAEKLSSIFDMFMQVDRTAEQSQGGLGIGLTLVKRLAEMHGGSIEAKSPGEGQGSEFVVRLPILQKPAQVSAPASDAAAESVQRRILIVDDNKDSADSLAMLLEITGNQTYMAQDGVEAVEAIENHRPEVVLLRHWSAEARWTRGLPATARAAVGQGHHRDRADGVGPGGCRRKSEETGFDGHLVKPVDYERLLELLG
jgi:CheY-like chemotaxis protein